MIGSTLRHYTIEARLGEGGMGTVYRARDTLLKRTVAIKVLAASDPEASRRLLHEARAVSALNHPNIVTVYAVEQQDDTAFIVMEHVEGNSLDRVIPAEGLPVDRAVDYARDIADALAAAHAQGIVHRDVKPANVMITTSGRAKVLDFGLARQTALPDARTQTLTLGGTVNADGRLAGTPGYLAPEQVSGAAAGPPSDLFGFGAVLYHMLAGRPPFGGETIWSVMDATLRQQPASLTTRRREIPAPLDRLVAKCLEKDPAQRYGSAAEVSQLLHAFRREPADAGTSPRSRAFRAIVAAGLLLALAAIGILVWQRVREGRVRWARETAVPEMNRLTDAGQFVAAYRLGQRALATAPDDPQVRAAVDSFTLPAEITSNPVGADVAFRAYSGQDEGWIPLGPTPVTARLPLTLLRWRFSKDGYEPLEIAPNPRPVNVKLLPAGTSPADMVFVPAGAFELESRQTSVNLGDHWIDKFEVTNRQFKAFIDAGGYRSQKYWTEPFRKDGGVLSWQEAMAKFQDATGRPGPSTWELGAYKDGEAEWPVSGVSWYEAAAYAAFAGKSLPTVYHWYNASGAFQVFSEILRFSNFGGQGTARVGSLGGLGPYGTYDMAGNVKEWTWNESSDGYRFVLGGAWNEPAHQFRDEDARVPFERSPGFGFRCVRLQSPPDPQLTASIRTLVPDPALLEPATDDVYQNYRRLYEYDAVPLDARTDERDDSPRHWVEERISVRAAYGTERLPVVLFLPRSAKPPYQVVVHFPGANAPRMQSSRPLMLQWLEFLMRDGRAVAYPIYQQTYERRRPVPQAGNQNFLREISIQRGLDVRRTVDYLASRPDIDASKIAFYGLSLGAQLGPVYLAIEPRFQTGILLSGGFETWTVPPETDPVHFAPRVHQPVLMVNGRDDFDLPYKTAQLPLLRALGTAEADKRHAVLEGGHMPPEPQRVFKEILDWLDRYLGQVAK